MIYKIQGEFKTINMDDCFTQLSNNFIFMYSNDFLICALKDVRDKNRGKQLLQQIFTSTDDFWISEVNKDNVSKLPDVFQEWSTNQAVNLEHQLYEIERQAKIQETWKALDIMKDKLEEYSRKNKRKEE